MSTASGFEFLPSTEAYFGAGRSRELPELIERKGWSRPAVVVDRAVARSPAGSDVLSRTADGIAEAIHVTEVVTDEEPDYDYLDECAAPFRERDVDCLIGIGGGSAMDLCKGIAVLTTNPGRGIDYRGLDRVGTPSVPTILVPTTAGTGSETTPTAVFIDRGSRTKLGINGVHVAPRLALLDPDLTASCPRIAAIGAGLDAMVHALEAYMSCAQNPVARDLAVLALSHLFSAFTAAVNDPNAVEERLEMQLGAFLAGVTLRYSGGGVMGALSYPLGAEFGIPHGLAGGVLIPVVARLNVARGYDGFAQLEGWLSVTQGEAMHGGSNEFLDRIDRLFEAIAAPRSFDPEVIGAADIPAVIEHAKTERAPLLAANPARVDDEFLRDALEAVVSG